VIELHRIYLANATVGVLAFGGRTLATLEDVGPGEVPNTCVPEGDYELVPHAGPKYPDTFALVGGIVSHQPEPGAKRSAVLFHWGNTTDDTLGCVLLGSSLSLTAAPSPAVFNSRLAFGEWLAWMKKQPGPHRLRITRG